MAMAVLAATQAPAARAQSDAVAGFGGRAVAVSTVTFVIPPHRMPVRAASVLVLPAARPARHARLVGRRYDATLDRSEVAVRPVALDARTTLRASFWHAGTTPSHLPFAVTLTVARAAGAPPLPPSDSLVLVLDGGVRVAVDTTDGLACVEPGEAHPSPDAVVACVPLGDFLRLATGRRARLELGIASWTLGERQLEALRALASRMAD
jgi:hypothetical protein